jgi:hypothetical protein
MAGITTRILSSKYFLEGLKEILKEFYLVNEETINSSIDHLYFTFFSHFKDGLHFFLEFPYVDKFYRNSYYNYYSSKNYNYSKETVRVSIFNNNIDVDSIFDKDIINKNYLGYFVIRPTFPNILGRNVISPFAFSDHNFSIVTSKFNITVNSLKTTIEGFPHSSQDGESITCAETTIWSIIEYFSNKYNDYNPLLPSEIHKILSELTYERQMPSKGLQAHQISFALKKMGFGVRVYSKSVYNEFDKILNSYIESGIPLVACVRGDRIGHAFNIVGRRNFTQENFDKIKEIDLRGDLSIRLKNINSIENEFVYVDDNFAAYRIGNIHNPCIHYNLPEWNNCEITEIIVPLYTKIYMEAGEASFFSQNLLKLSTFAYKNKSIATKTFLCSSRSYKNYIMNLEDINLDIKKLFLNLSMPKFIWTTEIYDSEHFLNSDVIGLILLDATEPKSTHVIGAIIDNVFIRKNLSENISVEIPFNSFKSFNDNLKSYGDN